MKTVIDWLEHLTLRQGVLLYLGLCILASVIICGFDWWFRTGEVRAIKRRDKKEAAEKAKRQADARKWELMQSPLEPRQAPRIPRIPRRDIDPAHRNGQFSVSRSMCDQKGVHK
jgi:hypothetical protein